MPRFRFDANAKAYVQASTYIEADTDDEAYELAKTFFESGDAMWKYDGVIEDGDGGYIEIELTHTYAS